MKLSMKVATAKLPTTIPVTRQSVSQSLPALPKPPITSRQLGKRLHTISTSNTTQKILSIFFFIIGVFMMAKVFHHF